MSNLREQSMRWHTVHGCIVHVSGAHAYGTTMYLHITICIYELGKSFCRVLCSIGFDCFECTSLLRVTIISIMDVLNLNSMIIISCDDQILITEHTFKSILQFTSHKTDTYQLINSNLTIYTVIFYIQYDLYSIAIIYFKYIFCVHTTIIYCICIQK